MEMVNMSETTNKSQISRGPISRGSALKFDFPSSRRYSKPVSNR